MHNKCVYNTLYCHLFLSVILHCACACACLLNDLYNNNITNEESEEDRMCCILQYKLNIHIYTYIWVYDSVYIHTVDIYEFFFKYIFVVDWLPVRVVHWICKIDVCLNIYIIIVVLCFFFLQFLISAKYGDYV